MHTDGYGLLSRELMADLYKAVVGQNQVLICLIKAQTTNFRNALYLSRVGRHARKLDSINGLNSNIRVFLLVNSQYL
jgi:hypothetical protein